MLLGMFRWRGLTRGIASELPLGTVVTVREAKIIQSLDYLSHQEELDAVELAE